MSIPLSFLKTLPSPPSGIHLGDLLAELVTDSGKFNTLLDCLSSTTDAAIHSPDPLRPPLHHDELRTFVSKFTLPHSKRHQQLGPNDRVMVVLPTGPENALALLALASYHACVPVNATCTASELKDDAERLNVKAVMTTRDAEDRLELQSLSEELGLDIIYIHARPLESAGLFDMSLLGESHDLPVYEEPQKPSRLHGLYDQSLVLHTSGTSGKKKVVPYTLRSLIVGAWAVVQSWDLQPSDVNMNMMPLFHVGGIIHNLLAPMLSGGSAIMCSGFDPITFWSLAPELKATWYYTTPTIHHAILTSKPDLTGDLHIRMICNAAGGLLPSLAADLKKTFVGAVILPSYGMTECMPIVFPPVTCRLDRTGFSSIARGPYLSIRDPRDLERELPCGQTGAVSVRGIPTFDGNQASPDMSVPLGTFAFTNEGWFDSGDVGYIDSDGYLFITGRSKEIINDGEVHQSLPGSSINIPSAIAIDFLPEQISTVEDASQNSQNTIPNVLRQGLSVPSPPAIPNFGEKPSQANEPAEEASSVSSVSVLTSLESKPQSGTDFLPEAVPHLGKRDSSDFSHLSFVIDEPEGRQAPRIQLIPCIVKSVLSIGLVGGLVVGYARSFKVVNVGPVSLGLYGIILAVDFLIQFSCALLNRRSVNKIAAQASGVVGNDANEKGFGETEEPRADISIAVVGYREDEDAWRNCLRSLQQQTLQPRSLITVVDGNEPADLTMAHAFEEEFQGQNAKVIDLPVLLSTIYQDAYREALAVRGEVPPGRMATCWRWLRNTHTPGELEAHKAARDQIINEISIWESIYGISSLSAVCFTQPHGHKRTAMFTAFAVAMYCFRSRDAVFTTDSDTLLERNALDEMYTLLASSPNLAGVTADVKIWNRNDSFLALMCSLRYWFAFNVERGCQSFWGCVGCISGPMGMYRTYDLDRILGPWSRQTFGGKYTTFGDDRHLTNHLLSLGLNTRYTHRTFCQSESPTQFVRWVKQQTRWSKSFFREAFWFPSAFAHHSFWLTVETTTQALYPFILIATVLHLLFHPTTILKPVVWLATMFAVAFIKSLFALALERDPHLLLFSFYGVFYFFGLLPSKIYALPTIAQTTWGTSARSSGEIAQGDSFSTRTFHLGHLVVWYSVLSVGIAYFLFYHFHHPLLFLIALVALIMSAILYIDFGAVFKKMICRCKSIMTPVQRDLGVPVM